MMRTLRTAGVAALLGAAALVGVPATSSAATQAPTSFTTVAIEHAPWLVAGKPVELTGGLFSEGKPLAGETARLMVKKHGADSYRQVATAVSDSNGNLRGEVRPWRNFRYFWAYDGDSTHAASKESPRLVLVSTRVTMRVNDLTPEVGQRVVVTGRTTPAKPGQWITLWTGGKCHDPALATNAKASARLCAEVPGTRALVSAKVRADGTYRLVYRFKTPRERAIFAEIAPGRGNAVGWSPTRKLTVH